MFRYGGGPILPRKAINTGLSQTELAIEVYPLRLQLHLMPKGEKAVIRISKKVQFISPVLSLLSMPSAYKSFTYALWCIQISTLHVRHLGWKILLRFWYFLQVQVLMGNITCVKLLSVE